MSRRDQYLKTVRQNLAPIAQVAVAGQDNAALAIKPDTTAAAQCGGPARHCPPPARGSSCRPAAPAMGPASRVRRRRETKQRGALESPRARTPCISTLLNGFQGTTGVMPPKGGRTDAPDALVKQAVDYMVGLAK